MPQKPGSGTPATPPLVPTQARTGRNILGIAAAVIVLAALITAGWYGYSKIKFHKFVEDGLAGTMGSSPG